MSVNIYSPSTFDCAYLFDSEIQEKLGFSDFCVSQVLYGGNPPLNVTQIEKSVLFRVIAQTLRFKPPLRFDRNRRREGLNLRDSTDSHAPT